MAEHLSHKDKSFSEVCARLDALVDDVRGKDTSLERSLDLFDQAIALGSKAVELIDQTNFDATEQEALSELAAQKTEEATEGAAENLAQDLMAADDKRAFEAGEVMGTPEHPEGQNAADVALEEAARDTDDGAWSPDR